MRLGIIRRRRAEKGGVAVLEKIPDEITNYLRIASLETNWLFSFNLLGIYPNCSKRTQASACCWYVDMQFLSF